MSFTANSISGCTQLRNLSITGRLRQSYHLNDYQMNELQNGFARMWNNCRQLRRLSISISCLKNCLPLLSSFTHSNDFRDNRLKCLSIWSNNLSDHNLRDIANNLPKLKSLMITQTRI